MVHTYYDRFDSICGYTRRRKTYPPQPASMRLQRWLQRAFVNSSFMRGNGKCRTKLKLKAGIAHALQLPSADVVIDAEGNLWHSSREKPIAVYVHGS
ncbi:hypothetical protein H6770_05785 [Candidatus Peribacteria bacterium]|nr:hypothetical protein [Candidatus Peribacteria bacterium]